MKEALGQVSATSEIKKNSLLTICKSILWPFHQGKNCKTTSDTSKTAVCDVSII
jgi:hypothetical protein